MSSSSPPSTPLRRARSLDDVRTTAAARSSNWTRYSVEPTPRPPRRATTNSPPTDTISRSAGPSTPSNGATRTVEDVYLSIRADDEQGVLTPLPLRRHRHRHHQGRMPTVLEPTSPTLPQLNPPPRTYPPGLRGRIKRVLVFFGHGPNNHARRELVALIWNLCFGLVQFSVTLAFVIYSTKHPAISLDGSTDVLSEWTACDKPLGVWNSLWLVRVSFGCMMTCWNWQRDRKMRQLEEENRAADAEAAAASPSLEDTPYNPFDEAMRGDSEGTNNTTGDFSTGTTPRRRDSIIRRQAPVLPMSKLYAKLSLLLSLFSMTWFLTAHILVYTSLDTCRVTSPHLWWLTFGILCILYVMILEVFLIAVIVFIIGPVIYLFWNILLICLGRHPLQNANYINPDIQKLPKSIVDEIPLVLYIPPPPGELEQEFVAKPTPVYGSNNPQHTYPPKPTPPKRRFKFIRVLASKTGRSGKGDGKKADAGDQKGEPVEIHEWEDQWEGSEYPFVRLDGNRAACAICLMDFEEPKRISGNVIKAWARKSAEGKGAEKQESGESTPKSEVGDKPSSSAGAEAKTEEGESPAPTGESNNGGIQEVPILESGDTPRLEDAGEGSQPLRLLPCGHVFHKTCIDPWLTDVSGRCPTCQRAVTVPESPGKKKRSGQR